MSRKRLYPVRHLKDQRLFCKTQLSSLNSILYSSNIFNRISKSSEISRNSYKRILYTSVNFFNIVALWFTQYVAKTEMQKYILIKENILVEFFKLKSTVYCIFENIYTEIMKCIKISCNTDKRSLKFISFDAKEKILFR